MRRALALFLGLAVVPAQAAPQAVPRPIAAIYCDGGLDRAAELTRQARAALRDNWALALLEARIAADKGNAMEALRQFDVLARADRHVAVDVACVGRTLYEGDASEIAAREAAALRTLLANRGVVFDPTEAERLANEARAAEAAIARPLPPPPPRPETKIAGKGKGKGKGSGKGSGNGAATPADEFSDNSSLAALKAIAAGLKGETFVHLGTGRSLTEVDAAWTKMKAASAPLKEQKAAIWRVTLRSTGDTFYRLGVLADSRDSGEGICRSIGKVGQTCQPLATYGVSKGDFAWLADLVEAQNARRTARAEAKKEAAKQDAAEAERASAEAAARLAKEAGELNKLSEEELAAKYGAKEGGHGGEKKEEKKEEGAKEAPPH